MNKENIHRLKKYLFLISIFFSVLIGGHILYIYFYDNAIEKPIEGGSVSEGVIGDFPHLNPLLNSNDFNKNIIYLLYRGLLKYDFENKKIVGDLASCDIKNLHYVDCYLENGIKWSNGKPITSDDIVGTYNILKNSDINPLMSSLLKDTTITAKPGIISFSNKNSDVSFLQVFFQPIVPKEILDNIGNKELYGKFNPIDGVYSGPYKVDTVSYDDSLGIQKLILTKNEYYTKQNILISKYIYRIFRDTDHFLKHKDIINVFFDKNNIIGDSMSRLNKVKYYLNQYMSIFINEDKIKNYNLRTFLLSKIDTKNIIKNLGPEYTQAKNAYLLDSIDSVFDAQNVNLENTIREMGFYKKDYLLAHLSEESKKISESQTPQKVNTDLKYLKAPYNKKYNFVSQDNIVLEGTTQGEKVDEIYINDYKLSSFKKGEKDFFYKLKGDFKNIHPGENSYKIYFQTAGKKELKEEVFVIFSSDGVKLKNIESSYFKAPEEVIQEQNKQNAQSEERKKKILALDDKFYYDYNLTKFSLKLYYIEENKELAGVANTIKNSLETYGIVIDTIPISLMDLNKKVTSGEKDYDMILVGIDLGNFDYNIYPYFHSSQGKNGFSFSNLKNLNLDIILEELKTSLMTDDVRLDKEKQAIEIINDRKIFKALYKKESNVLIDKNIKNFSLQSMISSDLAVLDAINKSYVTSEKSINFHQKGIGNFIDFIINVF